MDYLGELAAIQQELSRSTDMQTRRHRVLAATGASPGERIIDAGCGGGLLLREIALAVGANGSALGIDLSHDQVESARAHCAGLAQAEVVVGDVRAIPAADGHFDAVLSTQVLEYVPDVESAVGELARVTRPGGRFVNVATVWGSLFFSGGDGILTEHVLAAWERHAPYPNLPVFLPRLLVDAEFDDVVQEPVTILNHHFHPTTFGYGAAHLMAAHACAEGALDRDAADAWLNSLVNADARGGFFVSVIPVLTTAVRAG